MDSSFDISRIIKEHSYFYPHTFETKGSTELPALMPFERVDMKQELSDEVGERNFEFISITNAIGVKTTSLEDCEIEFNKASHSKVEPMSCVGMLKEHCDPLFDDELVPKRVLLDCQEKYEKKIEALHILMKNIVKTAKKEEKNSNVKFLQQKIQKLEERLEEKEMEVRDSVRQLENSLRKHHASKISMLRTRISALEVQNRNLKRQVKSANARKLSVENSAMDSKQPPIATAGIQYENRENLKYMQDLVFLLREEKKKLRDALEQCKKHVHTKEVELKGSEFACSLLKKELEEQQKYSLKSRQNLSVELVLLNKDIKNFVNSANVKIESEESCGWKSHKTKDMQDASTVQQDDVFRDIEMQLEALRRNVSLLKLVLKQQDIPQEEELKMSTLDCQVKEENCDEEESGMFKMETKDNELDVLSCTDKKCQWKDAHNKALKQYDPAPINQHPCFSGIKKMKKKTKRPENVLATPDIQQTADTSDLDDIDKGEVFGQLLSTQAITRKKPAGDRVKDLTEEQAKSAIERVMKDVGDSAFAKHLYINL